MRIAVLGCGNMASAIIQRVHEVNKNIKFHTYTPSRTKSIELSSLVYGIHHDELSTLKDIDYWFIACKPQQLNELATQLGSIIHNQVIISVLAATSVEKLRKTLKSNFITRVMPNTPSRYAKGIELLVHSNEQSKESREFIHDFMKCCGDVHTLKDDKSLEELTTFSGCGPAYVFKFALAYEKKLIKMGYSKKLARELLNQLFSGSAELMSRSNSSLSELVDQVTSKGGVTIEAVKVLESQGIDEIVSHSIDAALLRSKTLADEID